MAQGWDYTDPVSEAQADLLQIDMGIKTPQMAAAERGRDWEEMQLDLAAARAFRKLQQLPDVAGSYTRDRVDAGNVGQDGQQTTELDQVKGEAEAYGVAVRAGVITPQTDDENAFRDKLKLPPMSEAAKSAWVEDKGARRPITLVKPGETQPTQPQTQDGDDDGE
jgi:hypothetical protein